MFHGSIVALVTPMQPSGDVDYESLDNLIDWHIDQGTDSILVLGTTGESATITSNERKQLIKHSVAHINGRVPLLIGTGTNSTKSTIELTRQAMEYGADAALIVTPYYNKPTQDGLYLHYKTIANAVAIPQIIYNVPGRTGCDILPETVCRLADTPNIIGVKEATGQVDRVKEIINKCPDALDCLSGDDPTGMEFMLAGGKGVISVTANIAPKLMHDMTVACANGDRATAERINQQLMPLHTQLFIESNPIPTKWALHAMGKISTGIRMPLTPLTDQSQPIVSQALQQAGIAL